MGNMTQNRSVEFFDYYLFRRTELEERFAGWTILSSRYETFPAPGETRKEFSTVIAEKPGQAF